MAEAILRHEGGERFIARSTGVSPAGFVHALAQGTLVDLGISFEGQYSKPISEVVGQHHDIVLTVCDAAACATLPAWPSQPVQAHWSLPDPVHYPGNDEDKRIVAREVAEKLREWIKALVALPLESMSPSECRQRLYAIAAV